MPMRLDYKLLAALDAVVAAQGFERAAKTLHLTQSAISQRIKLLEDQIGQVLLVRSTPPRPTSAGATLLQHFQQIRQQQEVLLEELDLRTNVHQTLRLAANADSVATWLAAPLFRFAKERGVMLDLRIADQADTHKWLEQGEVMACISSRSVAAPGCECLPLGSLDYQCAATPDFCENFFAHGADYAAFARAPAVEFGPEDGLQDRFLLRQLGELPPYPRHRVPSAQAYHDAVCAGLGYGMLPNLQSAAAFAEGRLVAVIPSTFLHLPLYWQHWQRRTPLLNALTELVLGEAARHLSPMREDPTTPAAE